MKQEGGESSVPIHEDLTLAHRPPGLQAALRGSWYSDITHKNARE